MSLSDWFNNLTADAAQHSRLLRIPCSGEAIEIKEGQHYFRLWLAEMFLRDNRRLFRDIVPVVSSVVRLQFGAQTQELPCLAGPLGLTAADAGLSQGVGLNYALTGLLPYRGGNVSVSAGLFAYVVKDYLQELLTVLGSLSGLLTGGQVSSALNIAGAASGSIQNLLGTGDKQLRLAFHDEYSGTDRQGGNSLTSGFFAVLGTEAAGLDAGKLRVSDSRLYYGDDPAASQALTGCDYMLLRVEAAISRDDFRYFNEYNTLLYTAVEKGMTDRAAGDAALRTALLLIFKSDDLTYVDKARVAAALKQEYEERLSFQAGAAGREQWLTAKTAAFEPAAVLKQIMPLLANHQLAEAAVAGGISAMILKEEGVFSTGKSLTKTTGRCTP